jgi:hypothetical protein
MDFLDRPVIVAVVGALVAAAIGAIGYLTKRRLGSDRSDLVVYAEGFKQVLPLTGEQPQFAQRPVYCEAVRFHVLVSHNQKGTRPVRVKRLEFETRPVNISRKVAEALNYQIDASAMQGFGIVDLQEYSFQLSHSKIVGQYFESRERSLSVDPENVFHSTKGTIAFDIRPQSESALQPVFVLETASPGLYQSRLRIHYDIGGKSKEQATSWIYVFMQQ